MKPLLEELETRLCPAVTYHGGVVLEQAAVTEVAVGVAPVSPALVSDYLSHLQGYGVRGGAVDSTLQLPYQGSLSDAQVQSLVKNLIAGGLLPGPDGFHRMYLVMVPPPVQVGGAYHGYFTQGFTGVPYAVATNVFGATHELAEAATDPFLSGWYDGTPQTGEVCDVAHAQTTLQGQTVAQAQAWNYPYAPTPEPPPLLAAAANAYAASLWYSYVGDQGSAFYWYFQFLIDLQQAGAI